MLTSLAYSGAQRKMIMTCKISCISKWISNVSQMYYFSAVVWAVWAASCLSHHSVFYTSTLLICSQSGWFVVFIWKLKWGITSGLRFANLFCLNNVLLLTTGRIQCKIRWLYKQ